MASTISTARRNLFDLLAAHTWPGEQPQVTYGVPVGYEEQDVVALGGVEEARHDEVSLGGQRQEETYDLLVEIKAYDPAAEADEVDARFWQIADEVRTVVHTTDADDRNLKGAVRTARVTGMSSTGTVPASSGDSVQGGWVAFGTVRITCAQRIT